MAAYLRLYASMYTPQHGSLPAEYWSRSWSGNDATQTGATEDTRECRSVQVRLLRDEDRTDDCPFLTCQYIIDYFS